MYETGLILLDSLRKHEGAIIYCCNFYEVGTIIIFLCSPQTYIMHVVCVLRTTYYLF